MRGLSVGAALIGLVLVALGILIDPLGDALVKQTDNATFLASLHDKALVVQAGFAMMIIGAILAAGAAIVDAINRR